MNRIIVFATATALIALVVLAIRPALGEDPPPAPKARFVLLYAPGEGWVKGKSIYEQPLMEHASYMQKLMDEGKLLLGGPFTDSTGGEAVVECADAKEAQAILDADPAVSSKVFTATMHEWHVVFERGAK